MRSRVTSFGSASRSIGGTYFELLSHVLILPVLEQAGNELGTRVNLLTGLLIHLLRKQHARLDFEKRRCHHEEIRDEIEVFLLHLRDVVHIFCRDLHDRDVEDVDLIALNQMKQQVQRTLKFFQFKC